MRWLLVVGVTAACSFEHGRLSGEMQGSDATVPDTRPIDASIDAPLDASPTCLAKSTNQFGGHHYFKTTNGSWTDSQQECMTSAAHLVKIETMAENAFIGTTWGNAGYVWIGLHDPLNTDVWQWTDGTLLGVGYNAFPAGIPPTSTTANCTDTNGTWDPYMCSFSGHGGICECE